MVSTARTKARPNDPVPPVMRMLLLLNNGVRSLLQIYVADHDEHTADEECRAESNCGRQHDAFNTHCWRPNQAEPQIYDDGKGAACGHQNDVLVEMQKLHVVHEESLQND